MELNLIYLWFILAGTFAGFCAGLFGVGGGLIIVPVLMAIFKSYGYSADVITHMAVGTSLATIMVTSISSMMSHNRHGAVRWDIWRHMSLGLVLGSLIGAWIADLLDGKVLSGLIAVMAILMGIKMLTAKKTSVISNAQLPSVSVQFGVSGLIGATSALFGIGGGSLTVPFLNKFGLPMQQAVGTSAACGLPIAIAGAIGFAVFGQDVVGLPKEAIGFVHISAFVCISIASFIMAKVGAKLAHKLPAIMLKRAFGGLLVVVGLQMLWEAL